MNEIDPTVDAEGYCTDLCRQQVVNGSCACMNRNVVPIAHPKEPNKPIVIDKDK